MTQRINVKKPDKRTARKAGKGLSSGNLGKNDTRSLAGRVAAEASIAARERKK